MTAHSKPFRLRVQEALTAGLETISRTAGPFTGPYTYNLAGQVFRGRGVFGNGDPLPMLSILEDSKQLNDDALVQETNQISQSDYKLLIQGWMLDDLANPTDPVQYLLADVKAKLYDIRAAGTGTGKHNTILGFGPKVPCVREMAIGSGVILPPHAEISNKGWFYLPLTLRLTENGADAFTS